MEEDDWVSLNATFPQKLYALMHHDDNYESVAWLDHGKSFRILNPDRFSNEVIPKYFKHAKLTSFQRQLNLYGFRRITKGEDQGAYFHPKFQHERQDLLDVLECFLHALRLHWVEFQNKFFKADGVKFHPYDLREIFKKSLLE